GPAPGDLNRVAAGVSHDDDLGAPSPLRSPVPTKYRGESGSSRSKLWRRAKSKGSDPSKTTTACSPKLAALSSSSPSLSRSALEVPRDRCASSKVPAA